MVEIDEDTDKLLKVLDDAQAAADTIRIPKKRGKDVTDTMRWELYRSALVVRNDLNQALHDTERNLHFKKAQPTVYEGKRASLPTKEDPSDLSGDDKPIIG